MHILGIDIAKATFSVTLLAGQQEQHGQFENNGAGFARLQRWLQKRKAEPVHACMEATSAYWEELALFLHEQGHPVSVVNPKLIKRHAESIMQRNKTDRQDARTIADYCAKHAPALWSPPPVANRRLRTMVRHLRTLKEDRTRERNRLKAGISEPAVVQLIEAHLAFLDEQITTLEQAIRDHIDQDPDLKADKELLLSIPGIGDRPPPSSWPRCRTSPALQMPVNWPPTPVSPPASSSLVLRCSGPGRLVKWGNAHLRAGLYLPALAAQRFNPSIAPLRQRLLAREILSKVVDRNF
jgi:transposase